MTSTHAAPVFAHRTMARASWRAPLARLLIALVAGLVALGMPVAGPAAVGAFGDPVVHHVHEIGPVTIPEVAAPPPLATLTVPPGRWLAWAKLQVSYAGHGYRQIRCDLRATGAMSKLGPANMQVGRGTPVSFGVEEDTASFALSASRVATASPTTFTVRCVYEDGGFPEASLAKGEEIWIMAMRVGALKQVPLIVGSTGGGETPPAEPPIRQSVPIGVLGYRSADLAIPEVQLPQTLASLPLGTGRWWIRTSFTVQSVDFDFDPINGIQCRLVAAADTQRLSPSSSDRAQVEVLGAQLEGDRTMFIMDTAAALAGPGAARVQCALTFGPGDVVVRDLRITALKVGSLSTFLSFTHVPETTSGTGTPVAMHARAQGPVEIPAAHSENPAALMLPEGTTWMAMGKLSPEGGDIDCFFSEGTSGPVDRSWDSSTRGETLPFQVIAHVTPNDGVWFGCSAGEDLAVNIKWIRITAIRINGSPMR